MSHVNVAYEHIIGLMYIANGYCFWEDEKSSILKFSRPVMYDLHVKPLVLYICLTLHMRDSYQNIG